MSDKFKLPSQAMRLGATFVPQCFNAKFRFTNNSDRITGSCALGAIHQAIDPDSSRRWPSDDTLIIDRFPKLGSTIVHCPACKHHTLDPGRFVFNLIVHLNDHHRWTREEIADWLEKEGY